MNLRDGQVDGGGDGGGDGQRFKLYAGEAPEQALARETVRAPDLSASILARVHESRPFADARVRARRRWARLVGIGAASGLSAALAIGLFWAPEVFGGRVPGIERPSRPVTALVEQTTDSARETMRALREAPALWPTTPTTRPARAGVASVQVSLGTGAPVTPEDLARVEGALARAQEMAGGVLGRLATGGVRAEVRAGLPSGGALPLGTSSLMDDLTNSVLGWSSSGPQ